MSRLILGHPEVKRILRGLPRGYRVRASGKAKFVLVDPQGRDVRAPGSNQPFVIPNSPSSKRRLLDLRKSLQKMGLLTTNH